MNIPRRLKREWILLIPIVFLASTLTFYPHQNYPYLLHVDEWFHIAEAKQVVLDNKIDWYTGKNFTLGMEKGWHLVLALIQLIFKPTIKQWIYLPVILHITSILVVYYFVYKLYSGREAIIASLLIALIPSNVTIGGPVFIVPVNLSLILIPLALIFAFKLVKIKNIYNYLLLLLIATFLLYSHPPTAMVLILILTIYFLLQVSSKEERGEAIQLLIVIISSIILSIPNYIPTLQRKGLESIKFNFWVYLEGIPLLYGFIPTIFFIIGVYIISKKGDKRSWTLIIASLLLIVNILFFTRTGLTYLIPYQRTYIPLFLLVSIIASRGYSYILRIDKPRRSTGLIILITLLILTTYIAVERNIEEQYYHLIDDEDYHSFLWIRENTSRGSIILLNPWKARALPTIAERRVYAVMPFGPDKEELKLVEETNRFLKNNCTNTTFLIENNINIVYTRGECKNKNLVEIKENIYILETHLV